MLSLAELTAAGRADLLPGYTVSQLRLRDLAQIEMEAEQRYRAIIRAAAVAGSDEARAVLFESAEKYVAAGNLLFGMSGLDDQLEGNELAGLMIYLSLRREHPGIDRRTAEQTLRPGNAKPVRRFLLESLGFKFEKPDPDDDLGDAVRRPINWRPMLAIALKRGMTPPQIGELTYSQLDFILRPNGGKEDAKRAERRMQRQRKRKRSELFDHVCSDLAVTPRQLAMMDIADVATAAERTGKAGRINDLPWLRRYVDEYVAERGKA